ncbi:hypothetical protein RB213_012942 [Colletotrichum asianum]
MSRVTYASGGSEASLSGFRPQTEYLNHLREPCPSSSHPAHARKIPTLRPWSSQACE